MLDRDTLELMLDRLCEEHHEAETLRAELDKVNTQLSDLLIVVEDVISAINRGDRLSAAEMIQRTWRCSMSRAAEIVSEEGQR